MASTLLTAIFAVFTAVGEWIMEQLAALPSIFWNTSDNSLTFLGVLAIVSLGISIIFLMIRVIQNFLHFRG